MPSVNILISYRRDDAAGHAGRLCDRLEDRFPGGVFMDVTGIAPGADFVRALEQKLASCHVLIVVIGKSWLSIMKDRAGRDERDDHARIEVATALRKGVRVIPVLVQGARMPSRHELPEDLKPLADRNALEITEPDFRNDVLRLIEAIVPSHQPPPPSPGFPRWLKVALGVGVAAVLGIVILRATLREPRNVRREIITHEVSGGQALVSTSTLTPAADAKGNQTPTYASPTPGRQALVSPSPARPAADAKGNQTTAYANPTPDPPFIPQGRWGVTRKDNQQWLFDIMLGPSGAQVQYPSFTQYGNWRYNEGARAVTVFASNGIPTFTLRVDDWHNDHFHGQWMMAGQPPGAAIVVNIKRG